MPYGIQVMMPSSSWIDEYAWKGGLGSKSQRRELCLWTMFSYFLYSWWSAIWGFTDQGQTALPGRGNPTDSYLTSPLWAHLSYADQVIKSSHPVTSLSGTHASNHHHQDFPGGPVVKNPLSDAADTGSVPGQGTKIPHAMGQLSPQSNFWACLQQATESMCSGPCTPPQDSPDATTGESARHNKDPACCS